MPPKREVASVGGPCHPALVPDGNPVAAQVAQLVELHKLPLVFDLDQGEQEVVDHFTSQARRGKEVSFDDFSRKLETCKNPFLMLIKLSSQPVSAAGGDNKMREMINGLVLAFEGYLAEGKVGLGPDDDVKDMAFQRFLAKKTSLPIMESAFTSYGLIGRRRYSDAVRDIIRVKRQFKQGCSAAVALQLFDQFPMSNFCQPLLLCNDTSTMEAYLDRSPKAARQFISWLDGFQESTVEKISELTETFPEVEPVGSNRFFSKSLDKMIKKYAEMFTVDSAHFPITMSKRASAELYYWVKQMFTQEEHAFTIANWRDFIAMKVRGNEVLKLQLVNNLFSFDIDEAKHWNDVFGFHLFDRQSSEEEDWDEEIENPTRKTKKISVIQEKEQAKDRNDNFEESKEVYERWGNDDGDFYKLKLPKEDVMMVDTKELFEEFLRRVAGVNVVGVDMEYTPSIWFQRKIDIVQIATSAEVFLIDLNTLSSVVGSQDFARFAEAVFENGDMVKVGCGLDNDLRMLSKSNFVGLHTVVENRKSIVDFGTAGSHLLALLDLPGHTRGLSGFCEVLLGKPLSKVDQVSDWGRRPLRLQQIYYAALDAYVGLEIYLKLIQMAEEKGIAPDRLSKVLMTDPTLGGGKGGL